MNYNELLANKIIKEYQEYRNSTLNMSPEFIYNSSEQTLFYCTLESIFSADTQIVDEIVNEEVAKKLFEKPNTLEYIHEKWMNSSAKEYADESIDNSILNFLEEN